MAAAKDGPTIPLREYFEQRFEVDALLDQQQKAEILAEIRSLERYMSAEVKNLERYIGAKLAAAEEAVTKAEVGNQRHFESINGLNDRLEKQQTTFSTREYVDAILETLREMIRDVETQHDKRLKEVEGWRSHMEGRMWTLATVGGGLIIVINIVISVALKFL